MVGMALLNKQKREDVKKAIGSGDTSKIKEVKKQPLAVETLIKPQQMQKTAPANVQAGPARMDRKEMEKILEVFSYLPKCIYPDGKAEVIHTNRALELLQSLKSGGNYHQPGFHAEIPKIGTMHPDDAVEIMQAALREAPEAVVVPAVEMAFWLPANIRSRLGKQLAYVLFLPVGRGGFIYLEEKRSLILSHLDDVSSEYKVRVMGDLFSSAYRSGAEKEGMKALIETLWPRFLALPKGEQLEVISNMCNLDDLAKYPSLASQPEYKAAKYMKDFVSKD